MRFSLLFLVCTSVMNTVDDVVRSNVCGYLDMLHTDQERELSVFTYYEKLHQEYSDILLSFYQHHEYRDILSVLTAILPTPATTVTVLAVIAYCAMFYAIVQFRRELIMMRQENSDAVKGHLDIEERLRETQEVNRVLMESLNQMRTDIASLPRPATPVPFDPEPLRAEYWDQYRYLYALINDKTEALDGLVKEHYYIHGNAFRQMNHSVDFLMSEYYRGQKASVEMGTQTLTQDGVPHGITRTSKGNQSKKSVHFI